LLDLLPVANALHQYNCFKACLVG